MAGYPASGKTTLINKLLSGGAPRVSELLGVLDASDWRWTSVYQLHTVYRLQTAGRQSEIVDFAAAWRSWGPGHLEALFEPVPLEDLRVPGLIVHLDLLTWQNEGHDSFGEDELLVDLITSADEVRIVTLWVEPSTLEARLHDRRIAAPGGARRLGRRLRRFFWTRILHRLSIDLTAIVNLYDDWMSFADQMAIASHTILLQNGNPDAVSSEEWETLSQPYRAGWPSGKKPYPRS